MKVIAAGRMLRDVLAPRGLGEGFFLLAAMLVNAATEVIGIAGLMPMLAVAADPRLIQANPVLRAAYDGLGFETARAFLIFLGVAFLAMYVVASMWTALTSWLCHRFSMRMSSRIATDLLDAILHRPYTWFLRHNTSDLARLVTQETDQVVDMLIYTVATMMTRAISVLVICAGLVWLDPLLAVTVTTLLSLLYSQIYRVSETRVEVLGRRREALNGERHRVATESLAALKEGRVVPRWAYLVERFRRPCEQYCDVKLRAWFIGRMPQYLTECLAMTAIVGIFLWLLHTRANPAMLFPLLGLYAMATWRLVPMLQNLYSDVVDVQFYLPLLERLHGELAQTRGGDAGADDEPRLPLEREIRLQDVSFTYPEAGAPAACDVDLLIPAGTSVAFVGRTGSGKSTLADIVSGYLVPQEGSVVVDGTPLGPGDVARWQRNIGYVPQEIYLVDDTVRRNVALGLPDEAIDDAAVERACRAAHIHDFVVGGLERGYDAVLGERGVCLSGGQRQRIGIARALYHDPQVLIMDEATSSLDSPTETAVMEAIQELSHQKTLVVIAHRLSTVEACDVICLVENGRIAARGTFAELLERSPEMQALARAVAEGCVAVADPSESPEGEEAGSGGRVGSS